MHVALPSFTAISFVPLKGAGRVLGAGIMDWMDWMDPVSKGWSIVGGLREGVSASLRLCGREDPEFLPL